MKICLWLGTLSDIGGLQRLCILLANELSKEHDVYIASYDTPERLSKAVYQLDKEVKFVQLPKNALSSNIVYRIIRRILFMLIKNDRYLEKIDFPMFVRQKYVRFVNREGFEAIIGVHWYHSLWLAMIAPQVKAKTIGWQLSSFDAYFHTPGKYAWRKKVLFEKYISNLDYYVVLNRKTKEKVDASFDIESTIIYNPRSYVSNEKSDMKNKVFLAAGRMIYVKAFDNLVDAFHIFSQKNSDWKLLLVGDGEDFTLIKNKICKYGLEQRILMPGKTDNIKKYFLQSSVLLLPSRWEGMPMIGLEALEMGCPIIAYDIDAMEPIVSNGVNGLIVKKNQDINGYAKAMIQISENQELRERMHLEAIEKASQFSIKNIINEWNKILIQ